MGIEALTEVLLKTKADKELALEVLCSAMEREIKMLEVKLAGFEEEMRGFESKYMLSSGEFFRKFERGEFGDDDGYFNWWAAIHASEGVKTRIETLRELLGQCRR